MKLASLLQERWKEARKQRVKPQLAHTVRLRWALKNQGKRQPGQPQKERQQLEQQGKPQPVHTVRLRWALKDLEKRQPGQPGKQPLV